MVPCYFDIFPGSGAVEVIETLLNVNHLRIPSYCNFHLNDLPQPGWGDLWGQGVLRWRNTDRSRDPESALLLSLLSQSRGNVTESGTLHSTVLGSSLLHSQSWARTKCWPRTTWSRWWSEQCSLSCSGLVCNPGEAKEPLYNVNSFQSPATAISISKDLPQPGWGRLVGTGCVEVT